MSRSDQRERDLQQWNDHVGERLRGHDGDIEDNREIRNRLADEIGQLQRDVSMLQVLLAALVAVLTMGIAVSTLHL